MHREECFVGNACLLDVFPSARKSVDCGDDCGDLSSQFTKRGDSFKNLASSRRDIFKHNNSVTFFNDAFELLGSAVIFFGVSNKYARKTGLY